MRIRMLADFTYPLDESGAVTRTLPAGRAFDEPEEVAEKAIAAGYAEALDATMAAHGEAGADQSGDKGEADGGANGGEGASGSGAPPALGAPPGKPTRAARVAPTGE